jgi:hypothetical protein
MHISHSTLNRLASVQPLTYVGSRRLLTECGIPCSECPLCGSQHKTIIELRSSYSFYVLTRCRVQISARRLAPSGVSRSSSVNEQTFKDYVGCTVQQATTAQLYVLYNSSVTITLFLDLIKLLHLRKCCQVTKELTTCRWHSLK